LQWHYKAANPLIWPHLPSHLLSAFMGMIPVLMAEQTFAMVDALAMMSEYTSGDDRKALIARLSAVIRGKVPGSAAASVGPEYNPDNYPGQHLQGAAQVRNWFRAVGGFKKGQIEE